LGIEHGERMKVLVTGSLSYDVIMDFPGRFADRIMPDKIHTISLSFLVEKLNKQFGGTAGNVAYTLKLLGVEPLILSAGGNDFASYRQFLRRKKISTRYVPEYANVATGSYFVVTDREDNQIGAFYSGAMQHNETLSLTAVKETIDFVHIAPNTPAAMKHYVRECRQQGIPYMYDPAFQIADCTAGELREGIEGAAIVIGNDYEMSLVEGKLGISHEELLVMGPVVVTTLGARGSVIETRREAIHVKAAKPQNVSDPTGAGDAYRAGFLAGYLSRTSVRKNHRIRSEELAVCGQMGSVAAVYTVEKYGTQTHSFTKKEFIKRYQDNYGESIVL